MNASQSILIVDDNRALAENLKEILLDENIIADIADNCDAALRMLESGEYRMLLSDVRMPGVDGIQLAGIVHKRWPKIPVVMMTAYSSDAALLDASSAGALVVLSKPVDIEAVLSLVQRMAEPNAHVMLVEDDVYLRRNLTESLLDLGNLVPHMASDVATAKRLVDELPIRVAIVDARLPDGNGLRLSRELQARFGDAIKIICITGYAAELGEELDQMIANNEAFLLEKPFKTESLLSLIRGVM